MGERTGGGPSASSRPRRVSAECLRPSPARPPQCGARGGPRSGGNWQARRATRRLGDSGGGGARATPRRGPYLFPVLSPPRARPFREERGRPRPEHPLLTERAPAAMMRLQGSALLRELLRRPPAAVGATLRRAQPLGTLCRRPRSGNRPAAGLVAAARLHPWWGGGGRAKGPGAGGLSSSPSEILQELGKGGAAPQQQQQQQQPGASPPAAPPAPGPKDSPGETDAFGNSEGKEMVAAGDK